MLELMAVAAIVSITTAIAGFSMYNLRNPLEASAREMTSQFKLARARAMSSTSAYRLLPTSGTQISAQYAISCDADSADWTNDNQLTIDLSNPVSVTTGWTLCFNSRGTVSTLPAGDSPIVLTNSESGGGTAEIIVFLGGSVEAVYSD